jgi:hypothetical protein
VWLNSNIPGFKVPQLKRYDVVTTPAGWRVGLLGFLSDDKKVFRYRHSCACMRENDFS